MAHRIFLAGAAGAVGRRLTPLLCAAGHHVVGTTRSEAKAVALRRLGAEPVIVDVFDADALAHAVAVAAPNVVIHQLTDLPVGLDPAAMSDAVRRNARIRREGTANPVRAALDAGVRRLVAQSIAWGYRPGTPPYDEAAPLDTAAMGDRSISVGGVIALEEQVLNAPPMTGVVLRYGQLYGPGTGVDAPRGASPVHVDAAAHAALLAVTSTVSGIFNIAEPGGQVGTAKAQAQLGWHAGFRLEMPLDQ
jgi:nucleoside-diphosphate-sugar epimerase